jgi:hypothetical protein
MPRGKVYRPILRIICEGEYLICNTAFVSANLVKRWMSGRGTPERRLGGGGAHYRGAYFQIDAAVSDEAEGYDAQRTSPMRALKTR